MTDAGEFHRSLLCGPQRRRTAPRL